MVWRYFGDNRMSSLARHAVLQNMRAELGQGTHMCWTNRGYS